MKIPFSWLKEYVNIDVDIAAFAHDMTMAGNKVEAIEHMGAEITNVVVGRIDTITQHPNADKLVVCIVDIGAAEPVQIITGATNVFEGAYIPVALHGASLANDLKIKRGKIRGENSEGMLCSIEELGYSRAEFPEAPEDGIYIFAKPQPLGADARPILGILEDVLEFELTSNRPDCYSIVGIAREAAAIYDKPLLLPDMTVADDLEELAADMIEINISNPDLCLRYAARVAKNVKIEPSPVWMRMRLVAAGLRPVNNIVDITNYVMLEFGQPMHGFDLSAVADGKIIVRNAAEGEKITTLDGNERDLDPTMLVIADPQKAIGIAGIMGGEFSKVTEGAAAILFESANFRGGNIRQSAKKLGMRTDSSAKYEKGLSPHLSELAANRAAHLVQKLGCGRICRGMPDNYPAPRAARPVSYDTDTINRLLGTDISAAHMAELLKRLGIHTLGTAAIVPPERADIEGEADIAEEIGRLFGYDNIAPTLPTLATMGIKTPRQNLEAMVKNSIVAMGYCEALSYAFESPRALEKLMLNHDPIRITNPLGEDLSIMRTTTAPAMLAALGLNSNRRNDHAALFEIAKIYTKRDTPMEQEILTLGAIDGDYLEIKGDIEELLEIFGIEADYRATAIPYLHPGKAAEIVFGYEVIGWLGAVHPAVCDAYEIGGEAHLAILYMDALDNFGKPTKTFTPQPKFPAITRDIAIIVDESVPAAAIIAEIKAAGGKHLCETRLFDVYRGANIPPNHKSVALRMTFRAEDRTLTDQDADRPIKKILAALTTAHAAQLRE